MISWAVVGHKARLAQAVHLAHSVGAVVTIDDGTNGGDANHLKAWDITATAGSDWAAVLEDDAVPIRGFLEQAEQALSVAPASVVSFYLGRGRPITWQHRIPGVLQRADLEGAHWIVTGHVLHAVAIAMRTELRMDWLDWAPTSKLPIDERLSAWCRLRGHKVAYTVPSLVEHQDGPTLVEHRDGQPRTQARTAWRIGTRDNWNSVTVTM